jgi:hypothetical protein
MARGFDEIAAMENQYAVEADGVGEPQYGDDAAMETMADVDHQFDGYDWSPW